MLSRRTFLMSGAAGAYARPARRPNFLFILADDHAGYVLGADGNPLAATPNLDRLASEGTRFARHYCNSPVCTPSRQSFFTGLLPHTAGVTRLPTPLAEDKPTLARQFQKAGYRTAVFGKMHFNRRAEAGPARFRRIVDRGRIAGGLDEGRAPHPPPEGVEPSRDGGRFGTRRASGSMPTRCPSRARRRR